MDPARFGERGPLLEITVENGIQSVLSPFPQNPPRSSRRITLAPERAEIGAILMRDGNTIPESDGLGLDIDAGRCASDRGQHRAAA
jgi:hypothetical protein